MKRTKIGITRNFDHPFARFMSLRSADPNLQIYGAFRLPSWYYSLETEEKYWHDYFKEKRILFSMTQSYSEWFLENPYSVLRIMCKGMAKRAGEFGGTDCKSHSGVPSINDLVFIPDSELYSRNYGCHRISPFTEDLPNHPIIISSKNINSTINVDVNGIFNIL